MSMRVLKGLSLGLALVLSLSFTACGLFGEGTGSLQSPGTDSSLSSPSTDLSSSAESNPDTEGPSETLPTSASSDSDTPVSTATVDGGAGAPEPDGEEPPAGPSTDSSAVSSAGSSSTPPSSQTQTSANPTDSSAQNPGTEPEDKPVVNTDISPVKPSEYYGRVWLSQQNNGANLVKTYDEIVAGVGNCAATISLSTGLSQEAFTTVWLSFYYDYPQYFWLGKTYHYSYSNSGKVLSVTPTYTMSKGEIATAQGKFDAAVREFTKGIHSGMTQFEIEKTLHDRLILACTYTSTSHAHDAYGALVEGKAVCEGIANGVTVLCRAVGIEALLVTGTSQNPASGQPENHAWNIVKIDGDYYHLDVTWDNAGEPAPGGIHYAWFNIPTAMVSQDHTLQQEGYAYPNCTATKENYFGKMGTLLPSLTEEAVVKYAVKSGNSYVFQSYLQNQKDVSGWFSSHARSLSKAFGFNGYSYGLTMTGKEVIFVIGPYQG